MHVHRHSLKYLILFLFAAILLACAPKKIVSRAQSGKSTSPSPAYEKLLDRARHLINERKHSKALEVLEKAGQIEPKRPEWLYEKARALFSMDEYKESADACRRALDVDPTFYDAQSLGWAARIEADKGSDAIKQTVFSEIDDLLKKSGTDTDALLAAYQGYEWLKDQSAQQKLILDLAGRSRTENPEEKGSIAQELFEQIIAARKDPDTQIILMDAYIRNFPQRQFVEYIVNQLLEKKQETAAKKTDAVSMIASIVDTYPKSRRVDTGVAIWLIDQNKMPEEAVRLLQKSIKIAETEPEKKPPYFTNALWSEVTDKEKDYLHFLLGRAWFNAGDYQNAKTQFEMVANKSRHWGKVYYYLGMITLNENNPGKAISLFCRALEIDEHIKEARKQLSELLSQYYGYHGDPAEYFQKKSGVIHFDDVTEEAGLAGQKSHRVAWCDYNQDGYVDLLIDGHRLFQNTGNDCFIDVTEESGLGSLSTATGGVWGDYNNDGYPDIFITDHSGNHLFKNMGNGTFSDVTEIALGETSPSQTEAAAWGDLDNDGFLDLYVANYERPGVMRGLGVQDKLYHNNGDGTFTDISKIAGIHTDEAMCGRGVVWTDVNRDGYLDIAVANYRLDPNFLWINNHNATFTDQAGVFGSRGNDVDGAFGHSIGVVDGDLNNDGILDLFVTNLAHPRYIEYSDKDMMLISQGPPDYHYTNRFLESGIAFEETNSDPALADVDNDGDLDLYITSIYQGRYSHLYLNDGHGFFKDATWLSGTSAENSWGAAFADYNNDGFPDLAVASENGLILFRNSGTSNHWIKVKIKDENCNIFGIGAMVTVSYAGHRQVREIDAGRGTGSQDGSALIFGLGDYNGPVEVSAHTLCGDTFEATVPAPDQTVTLVP